MLDIPQNVRVALGEHVSEEVSFQKFCFKNVGPFVLLAGIFQGLSELSSRKPPEIVVNYLVTALDWSKYTAIVVGALRLIYGNSESGESLQKRVDYIRIPQGQFMSMKQEIIRLNQELDLKNQQEKRVL